MVDDGVNIIATIESNIVKMMKIESGKIIYDDQGYLHFESDVYGNLTTGNKCRLKAEIKMFKFIIEQKVQK